ncbi:MAG: hypothetical protein V2A54_16355 [Bacteroidota bacterium]
MKLNVLFSGLMLIGCTALFAQTPAMELVPVAVKGIAMSGGLKLSKCCTYSQTDLKTEVSEWRKLEDSGIYVIQMKVSWKGGVTGKDYWISGKLICDLKGCHARWEKESYSGGFNPNYETYCPLDCLEFYEKKGK